MQKFSARRPRALGALAAAAALALSTAAPAVAAELDTDHGSAADFGRAIEAPSIGEQLAHYGDAVVPDRYFVELDGRSGQQLAADAKTAGLDVTVRGSFSEAWTGVSVEVDDAKVGRLAGLRGVTGLYPVLTVERPVQPSAEPNVEYAKTLTGADVANQELGLTGEGVKVGIIDSGIDYNHPDLGGSGVNDETRDFPNERVQYGYDYVGDAYDSGSDDPAINTPMPDEYPDDCGSHGTHVAGIVGANGGIQGVAPDATFGAYRIFGCDGSSSSEVIMQAMEDAAADGMDVINMSLGASYMTWPSYPTAQLADELVDRGVVVVVSQGNSGTGGTFSSGAPGVAHNVITVGSVDNTEYMADYLTTPGGLELPVSEATDGGTFDGGETYEVVAADPINGCAGVAPASGPGQALLMQRGGCTFHDKALAAQEAGYDAAFLFNNTAGIINATVTGDPAITIPVATLLQSDGERLLAEMAGGTTTVTLSTDQRRFDNPTGGQQSDFSSYGLAADLTLKPDVSAPGGSIYSTVPVEQGSYGTKGGTSMSAPHVAGAAALLLEARPDLDPYEVRDRLSNTADPFAWFGDAGYREPVHRQGAGMIDIPQAVTTDIRVRPGKISLGEGEAGPVTTTLTVTNSGDTDRTFAIDVEHGVATYGPTNSPRFADLQADVEFSAGTVTVPAGQTATFTVVLGEDFGIDGAIYGGWITLTDAAEQLVVPFAGLSGDYQALRALTTAILAHTEDGGLYPADPFHTYTMEHGDFPTIFFNLSYPVNGIYFDVYRANPDGTKGAKVHNNFINYATLLDQGRFASATTLRWDGTYQGNRGNDKTRKVGDGDYLLEVRVLKALGDPNNPEHWETWNTPAFTIEWGPEADTSTEIGPEPGKGNQGKVPGKDNPNKGPGNSNGKGKN